MKKAPTGQLSSFSYPFLCHLPLIIYQVESWEVVALLVSPLPQQVKIQLTFSIKFNFKEAIINFESPFDEFVMNSSTWTVRYQSMINRFDLNQIQVSFQALALLWYSLSKTFGPIQKPGTVISYVDCFRHH